jgi:hypothetical protein
MIFKFKYMVQGNHTHYKLWTGENANALGSNGPRQTMRNSDWTVFKTIIEKGLIPPDDVVDLMEHRVIFEEITEGWLW